MNSGVEYIEVRGARVHKLRSADCDLPLHGSCSGVSGSGKTALVLGVLYAVGQRRCLKSLPAYTRRRLG